MIIRDPLMPETPEELRRAEVAGLRAEIVELHAELARRTAAVIVSDGGQALACSASVAAAYGTVREERNRLRAERAAAIRAVGQHARLQGLAEVERDRLRKVIKTAYTMIHEEPIDFAILGEMLYQTGGRRDSEPQKDQA